MMRLRERELGLSRRCHADWPAESTTTTEALAAKSLEMMRPREQKLGMIWRCHSDWPEVLTTTKGAWAEEDEPKDLTTTT